MEKLAPDYSFERQGLSFAEWLWQLVAEERATREAAGDVLLAMRRGLPSLETEEAKLVEQPDEVAQAARFEEAVRATVTGASFDTAAYLRKLSASQLAIAREERERKAKRSRSDAKIDRLAAQLEERMALSEEESQRERTRKQIERLEAAYLCSLWNSHRESAAGMNAHCLTRWIAQALGATWLAAPEALELMLDDEALRDLGLGILAQAGAAAIAFAPRLLRELDSLDAPGKEIRYYTFDAARALGAIARGNSDVVEALVARLARGGKGARIGAFETFEHMEGEVCGRAEEIVELLVPLLDREEEAWRAFQAFVSVGRDLTRVRVRVLEMAKPRPPRWTTLPSPYNRRYDLAMAERGAAITAMRYLTRYPDECVPALLEAIDTFEEYDEDECHDGPLARIANTLALFGEKAGTAAVPLARHVNDDPDGCADGILYALAAMGDAARAAVPFIEAFRAQHAPKNAPPADIEGAPIQEHVDLAGWALQRIRGIAQR